MEVELGYYAMSSSYEVWTPLSSVATINGLDGHNPHCSLAGGSLPSGVSLNSNTCDVEGTPNETGTFQFTTRLTVSGFSGHVDTSGTLVVTGPYLGYSLDGPEGVAWGEPFTSTTPSYNNFWPSGSDTVTYRLGDDAPSWMGIDSATGSLSGTPLGESGEIEFTVYADIVHDGHKVTAQGKPRMTINWPALHYQQNYTGTVGTAFSVSPQIPEGFLSGGFTLQFSYDSVNASCPLPTGLSIDPDTGRISGVPTEEVYSCMISVRYTATKGDVRFESYELTWLDITQP